jgi:hypothetical protein
MDRTRMTITTLESRIWNLRNTHDPSTARDEAIAALEAELAEAEAAAPTVEQQASAAAAAQLQAEVVAKLTAEKIEQVKKELPDDPSSGDLMQAAAKVAP